MLTYLTTTREGYREYEFTPKGCHLSSIIQLYPKVEFPKVRTRYLWKEDLEYCEEIRYQRGMKELYKKRKETIERFFETAKEYHNLRYSREKEKFRMEEKFGLTLVYLNFKKLVKWIANIPFIFL